MQQEEFVEQLSKVRQIVAHNIPEELLQETLQHIDKVESTLFQQSVQLKLLQQELEEMVEKFASLAGSVEGEMDDGLSSKTVELEASIYDTAILAVSNLQIPTSLSTWTASTTWFGTEKTAESPRGTMKNELESCEIHVDRANSLADSAIDAIDRGNSIMYDNKLQAYEELMEDLKLRLEQQQELNKSISIALRGTEQFDAGTQTDLDNEDDMENLKMQLESASEANFLLMEQLAKNSGDELNPRRSVETNDSSCQYEKALTVSELQTDATMSIDVSWKTDDDVLPATVEDLQARVEELVSSEMRIKTQVRIRKALWVNQSMINHLHPELDMITNLKAEIKNLESRLRERDKCLYEQVAETAVIVGEFERTIQSITAKNDYLHHEFVREIDSKSKLLLSLMDKPSTVVEPTASTEVLGNFGNVL